MTAKEEYRALCEDTSMHIPLFQQHWWMEAVCTGKHWDVLLARDKDGVIQAALPYLMGNRLGLRYILQPQLTQYNGIWYNYPKNCHTENQRLQFEKQAADNIIAQLKKLRLAYYQQNFSPAITNWLPFHWTGYRQTTRYTYRFPSIGDPEALISSASRARRQNMDDVAAACTIDSLFPPKEFAVMHREYFERKKGEDLLSQDFVEHICHTALERGQALLWALRNTSGKAVNVSFVVYDNHCAYALMSAITPQAPRNSQTYLFWQMIRHLSSMTQSFDFEGSMEEGNEYFYRTFGTVQTPYHSLWRTNIPFLDKILHG